MTELIILGYNEEGYCEKFSKSLNFKQNLGNNDVEIPDECNGLICYRSYHPSKCNLCGEHPTIPRYHFYRVHKIKKGSKFEENLVGCGCEKCETYNGNIDSQIVFELLLGQISRHFKKLASLWEGQFSANSPTSLTLQPQRRLCVNSNYIIKKSKIIGVIVIFYSHLAASLSTLIFYQVKTKIS